MTLETNLSSTHKLIISTLLLGTGSVSAAYVFSGVASLMVAATLCVILWIFRPLLMPPGYGATKIRSLSLLGVFALATSYGYWAELANTAVTTVADLSTVREVAPWMAGIKFGSSPSIAILIFVAVCVCGINYWMQDKSIAGGHPTPLKDEFPEETFEKKLKAFISALHQHITTTDREANWSPEYYTELEAEVEVISSTGSVSKRRIVELQEAVRSDRKTRAFLILGDPGGGKSVALRKLARDMLEEVNVTGRIPIYINLREWLPSNSRQLVQWTEDEKPTVQELEAFVMENIKARGDVFTEEFVDNYFRKLWQNGRLFFVFDSFDEIPELLDVNEESWLINALSSVLSRFITTHPESRGVLASRMFRRPTQVFLAQKILDIRPMSEGRIIQALQRFPTFTKNLQVSLFKDRTELVPIARNPFLMALLGEWVREHSALPSNQAELYSNYLVGRLRKCSSKLHRADLSIDEVLAGAEEIAWFVFRSPAYGLEAPVEVIAEHVDVLNVSAIMEILSYARVARVTSGEIKSFAFVHRRFLEYFVTKRLLIRPEHVPLEHIPSDSRGRDALVLYAQLCNEEAARKLAHFCWQEIELNFGHQENHLRAIHSLRFLIDAFRSRRDVLSLFEVQLAKFIEGYALQGDDLIKAKLCLEGTGLLSEADAVPVLSIAMSGDNAWLQETAFRACRQLPSLDSQLENALARYVITLETRRFWAHRADLLFSLSLSDSLAGVRAAAVARYRNLIAAGVIAPIAAVIQPRTALALIGFAIQFFLMRITFAFIDEVIDRSPKDEQKGARRRKGRFLNSLVGFDGEGAFQLARLVFGCGFVLVGILLLTTALQPPEMANALQLNSSWGIFNIPRELRGVLNIAFGLIIVDWTLLRVTYRHVIGENFPWRDVISTCLGVLLVVGPIMYGLAQLFAWLKRENLVWIPLSILGLVLSGLSLLCLIELYRRLLARWADRKRLKTTVVSGRLTRIEIACLFGALETKKGRLLLVKKIGESKLTPSGSWPSGFKLRVSSDPALTELAKLEERWLRLDR